MKEHQRPRMLLAIATSMLVVAFAAVFPRSGQDGGPALAEDPETPPTPAYGQVVDVKTIDSIAAVAPGLLPDIAETGIRVPRQGAARQGAQTSDQLTIVAFTPEGGPAVHVMLYSKNGMRTEALGYTDALGELVVHSSSVLGSGLIPKSDFFAHRVYEVPELVDNPPFEITLERSATLQGYVQAPGDTRAGAGIQVYAENVEYNTRGASSIWHQSPANFTATTNDEGAFTITGLRNGKMYSVYAGGEGLVSTAPVYGVAGTDEILQIRATFVFGAAVRFLGPDGPARALRYEAGATKTESVVWEPGHPIFRTSRQSALAGVGRGLAFADNPRLILFSSDDFQAAISGPPAEYTANFIGHWPSLVNIQLGWLGEPLPVYDVTLSSRASGFGEVVVRLNREARSQSGYRSPECTMAEARLILESVESTGGPDRTEFPLRGLFSGLCTLDGIPHGEYTASVQFGAGSYRFPEYGLPGVPIKVGAEPCTLELPVEDLCELRVDLINSDGEPYRGPAVFVLGEGEPIALTASELEAVGHAESGFVPKYRIQSGRGTIRFECAPYNFPFLRPNTYHIIAKVPRLSRSSMNDGMPPSVRLNPGELLRTTIEVVSEM